MNPEQRREKNKYRMAEWRARNRERARAINKRHEKSEKRRIWREANRERLRKYYQAYAQQHVSVRRETRQRWALGHASIVKERGRIARHKIRCEVLRAYGGCCACCGESEVRFLSIDHMNNNGAAHRRETKRQGGVAFYRWLRQKKYPSGYQVLCFNCNCAKGFWGRCPHLDFQNAGIHDRIIRRSI